MLRFCDFERAMLTWLPSRQIHSRWLDFLPVAEECRQSHRVFHPPRFQEGFFHGAALSYENLLQKSLLFFSHGLPRWQPLSTVGKPNYCRQLLWQAKLNPAQFPSR